jgi:hypothetical protein
MPGTNLGIGFPNWAMAARFCWGKSSTPTGIGWTFNSKALAKPRILAKGTAVVPWVQRYANTSLAKPYMPETFPPLGPWPWCAREKPFIETLRNLGALWFELPVAIFAWDRLSIGRPIGRIRLKQLPTGQFNT